MKDKITNDNNIDESKLRIFFANVTRLGESATTYLINRSEHILAVVETHLLGDKAHRKMEEFSQRGWDPIMSPATKAEDNDYGNSGGAMIFHKPWLQAATPAIAEGIQGRELPAGDLAWKHFRIKGLHLVFATLYLDHTIGITGVNVEKLGRVAELTVRGKRHLIVPADFNIEPDEWGQAPMDAMGL